MQLLLSLVSISLLRLSSAAAAPQDSAPYPYQCNPAHEYPAGQCCDGDALTLYSCPGSMTPAPSVGYTTPCPTSNGTTPAPPPATTPCPSSSPYEPPPATTPCPSSTSPYEPPPMSYPGGNGTVPKGPSGTTSIPQFTGAAVVNVAGTGGALVALVGAFALFL